MKVILHAGAHCTDDDKLLRSLIKNTDDLRDQGVVAPRPRAYRRLLNGAMNALSGAEPAPDALAVFMEAIMGSETGADQAPVQRLILSSESFFTVPKMALADGIIYPRAGERLRNLQKLFRGCEISLFIGLRNPATWLPAVFAATPHRAFETFLNGSAPEALLWSDLLRRLRADAPEIPITSWCNEDTPFLWGAILREMLGLPPGTKITGAFDLLSEVMEPHGMTRFRGYLRDHPDMSEPQKRQVMMTFLEKFAKPDALEEELDVAGWTEDFVEHMTEIYDADMAKITPMTGVTLLEP